MQHRRLLPDTIADCIADAFADTIADTFADAFADTIADTFADTIADTFADTIADAFAAIFADTIVDDGLSPLCYLMYSHKALPWPLPVWVTTSCTVNVI